jgi:hypothetical protein
MHNEDCSLIQQVNKVRGKLIIMLKLPRYSVIKKVCSYGNIYHVYSNGWVELVGGMKIPLEPLN